MLHTHTVSNQLLELAKQVSTCSHFKEFHLAGDTALALRLGHRESTDLDFFTCQEFKSENLISSAPFCIHQILTKTAGTLQIISSNVKIEFLSHQNPLLDPPETRDGIRLISYRDNIAMKINAICNRGTKKDFIDLHQILIDTSLDDILGWFEQKYPNTNRLLAIKSLGWFEDAENDPLPKLSRSLSWETVKKDIHTHLSTLK